MAEYGEGSSIVVLARILDHNIPDDAYGKALEGIEVHTSSELAANVPELEESDFTLYLYDSENNDIVH